MAPGAIARPLTSLRVFAPLGASIPILYNIE